MARSAILVGARVVLYVNGSLYAQVSSFSFSSDTPHKSIHGIDQMEPFELAPQTASCTGSLAVYRLVGDAGAEGAGFTVPRDVLSKARYFSLMLIDRHSDTVLFSADNCVLTNQNWSVATRSQITGTLSFSALSWSNELRAATT